MKLYEKWERKESATPLIQDTIKWAVDLCGCKILGDKEFFCAVLEDLSPNLYEEREFIQKVYSNAVGKQLMEGYMATNMWRKQECLNEIEEYLEEEGRNHNWKKRFIAYFSELILDQDITIELEEPPIREDSYEKNKKLSSSVIFRVISNGEEKGNMEFYAGEMVIGKHISEKLNTDVLFKIMYNKPTKTIRLKNLSKSDWIIINADNTKSSCKVYSECDLKKEMIIYIREENVLLNVVDITIQYSSKHSLF